jgi:hypothetical protein
MDKSETIGSDLSKQSRWGLSISEYWISLKKSKPILEFHTEDYPSRDEDELRGDSQGDARSSAAFVSHVDKRDDFL